MQPRRTDADERDIPMIIVDDRDDESNAHHEHAKKRANRVNWEACNEWLDEQAASSELVGLAEEVKGLLGKLGDSEIKVSDLSNATPYP